jgi:menaquinone-dependent protoporphyrinogen oxidase
MNKPTAIIYSTTDGHTLKICQILATHLRKSNYPVFFYAIEDFHERVEDFHSLIIGASVRYGKHSRLINKFIQKNRQALSNIKTAFFSVNLVARKKEKDIAEYNPYLIKFLNETKWQPDIIDVFAGKLDYRRYSFFDRIMVKLIMKLTKGTTKTDEPIVYTNWERVKQFGEKIMAAGFLHRAREAVSSN